MLFRKEVAIYNNNEMMSDIVKQKARHLRNWTWNLS